MRPVRRLVAQLAATQPARQDPRIQPARQDPKGLGKAMAGSSSSSGLNGAGHTGGEGGQGAGCSGGAGAGTGTGAGAGAGGGSGSSSGCSSAGACRPGGGIAIEQQLGLVTQDDLAAALAATKPTALDAADAYKRFEQQYGQGM